MLENVGSSNGIAFMKKAVCCFLVTMCAFAQSPSANSSTEGSAVLALERMWIQSQLNHDTHAIGSMIGEKFIDTDGEGTVIDRRKFLAGSADPTLRISIYNVESMKAETYPGTAVVTGIYHTKGTYGGKTFEHVGRFTDTWVFQDGKWLCVASHSSLIKK
jgi:hypothetical protein